MATRKCTITPPGELDREAEQGGLGELVAWLEEEYGPVTGEERAAAEAERGEFERHFTEQE
ncbi:hypothetical protein [Streptomyces sp. NPDC008137]|uniref:hypothetical protein n=1 Tax=Streptomyces sp. NPDC008137 TaxID=3364813 RepID=UPI0036E5CCAC